jgi:DNA replication protein
MANTFDGFQVHGKDERNILVPERFFWDLLPKIDNFVELKVTLYCFWAFQQQEGAYRYVRLHEALADEQLLESTNARPELQASLVREGFERAFVRGTLLAVHDHASDDIFYFPNSRRGREAVTAIEEQRWYPQRGQRPLSLTVEQPSVFAVYRNEIGTISPMVADALRQAEDDYPQQWILDAIRIAVANNARKWAYIQSILDRWSAHGRQEGFTTHQRPDGHTPQSSSADIDFSEYSER